MTTKNELIRKIRLFCNECMGGTRASKFTGTVIENQADVEGCTDTDCIFFDFRLGRDPNPNETLSKIAKARQARLKRNDLE